MGYFLQLRILLWKNLTLKKRTPLVLLFEISIPLVLFVVLVGIRQKQPAQPMAASYHSAQPLPSAGVLPIMQQFCDHGTKNADGFTVFKNNTIYQFLENLQAAAEDNNFFDPGFSPDEVDHIPELYRSIIDDPAMLHDAIVQAKDIKVDSILTNATDLKRILVNNFSLPGPDVDVLYHSQINFTEVYNIVFGQIEPYAGSFPTGEISSNNIPTNKIESNEIPRNKRTTRERRSGRQKRSAADDTPQHSFLSGLKNLPDLNLKSAKELINHHRQKSSKIADIAGSFFPTSNGASGGIFGNYGNGLLFNILKQHPEMLFDPEVQDVIGALYGFGGRKVTPDPTEVVDVLEKVLLTPDSLQYIICEDDHELSRILIPPHPEDEQNLIQTEAILCNMTQAQWQQLATTLKQHINSTEVVEKLHLNQLNYTVASTRVAEFKANLQEFILFERNMLLMTQVASSLPLSQCGTTEEITTETPGNATSVYGNTTRGATERDASQDTNHRSKRAAMEGSLGLLEVWMSMQKTVCGHVSITEEKLRKFQETSNIDDLGITQGEKYRIGILKQALYNNPTVLYAPNETSADTVISKANETFALIDLITNYATRWLNVSGDIRTYLMKNSTRHNLASIREMQFQLRQRPDLINLIDNATIAYFIRNQTVPEPEFFLAQLDIMDNAACGWLNLVKGLNMKVFRGFRTEDELVKYFLEDAYSDGVTVFASVIFTNLKPDGSLPPHVVYKIRQNATFTPTTKFVRDRYWHPGNGGQGRNYYMAGFVWIQDILERAIVDIQTGRDVRNPGGYVWETPYPCYTMDHFLFMIEHVMPLCLTISWVYSVAMLVQNIVYEKEQRLKEVMRMMGLSSSVHWLAWLLTTYGQMSITMAILTIILKFGQVLHYSNALIIFMVLEVFAMATIAFSFLVSVCYSKAKVAAACAGILYFLTYVPYMYIAIREDAAGDRISSWAKSIASLFSTTGFGLGAKYFAFYEIEGIGVQWDNFNKSPVEGDEYNLFLVTLMMVIDTLIYGILTWYIENVHPGSYGLPKPWYFPVTRSYWWGHPKTESEQCSWRRCFRKNYEALSVMEEDQACAIDGAHELQQYLETEPSHLPLGVSIQNLSKVYKTGKRAVNHLSLNFFEGQITSFLGHNGAGKTTTMSILTGLFPPTSGYATVYNNDIRTDMEEIRKSLGMCPQHNVLFDKLTVEEHLWFYARLKGLDGDCIKEDTDRMINDLNLPKKRHHTVDCLSGGMQRKLSVAIAFVGGSKTVILDEPTAGVDPYARRAIWDLLVKYKQGRTILLSTHHMDEADILGDRIAIISNGQLKCCGSSLFLKNMFGDGYHLMLVKKPSEEDLRSMDTLSNDDFPILEASTMSFHTRCMETDVTEFINRHVPTAYLQGENHRELHYILPFEEAKKGHFEKLFKALDKEMDSIHVGSYGVMDTSLEEVFLKVTERAQSSAEAENESNDAKEVTMTPAPEPVPSSAPVAVPLSQPDASTDNKDEASLSGGSILLGSNAAHDLELGTIARHARSSSFTHRRTASFQLSATESYSRSGQQVQETPEVGGGGPVYPSSGISEPKFVLRHRRSMSGTSWTPRLAQAHQDREEALSTAVPRGHRRAWSGSSWSRLSQFNGPITAPVPGQAPVHPRVAQVQQDADTQSVLSDGSDVSLLGVNSALRKKKGHQRQGSDVSLIGDGDDTSMATLDGYSCHMVYGYRLLLQQFMAVIVKRFYYIRRNWRGLFSQILLPALFVCIAMTVALTAPKVEDLPAMTLSPAQYYNNTLTGNFITLRLAQPEPDTAPLLPRSATIDPYWSEDADAQKLLQTFHMPAGVAATCVLRKAFNSSFNDAILKQINMTHRDFSVLEKYFEPECESVFTRGIKLEYFLPAAPTIAPSDAINDTEMIPLVTAGPHPNYYPECQCAADKSGQVCNKGGFSKPPEFKVITGDRLQDISGQPEENYYLNTYDLYRLNRYGGLSLGKTIKYVPEDFGTNAPSEFRKLGSHEAVQVQHTIKGYHSMPIYVNVLNNAILRANLPPKKGNPSAYGITVINHPMNNTNNGLSMAFIQQGSDVLIAIFIICAMSFVPASFVVFLVYEKSIKAKHLQVVSGINRVIYWLANLVWDMCNFIIPAACCIMILRIFNIPAYVSGSNFPAVISLFLLYGWSITPMMYPASFWFKEPSSAYISLIVINLFIGITCIITSFLLELFQTNDEELKQIHEVLKNIFLIFPNYCLGRGLMDIAFNEYLNEYFFKTGQYGRMKSPFEWTLMSRNLVAMAAMGFIFFVITLLCEFNFFRKRKAAPSQSYQTPQTEDADVADERKRVLRGRGRRDMLRLENLTQVYVTKKLGRHLAVDRLCLGVPQGECFGLLGVNGAGKTTTFKMLTGDLLPTGGDAVIDAKSILKDIQKVQQTIGYCPQFDALYDELTAREHLQLYARLRGIPYHEQNKVVEWAIKKLGLATVADNLSMSYSGGFKRKLSTAIALVGNPPVILLDEPTTGMDPHSRRFLWTVIQNLVQSGRSVILTSHSMEECEVLCTRMAIMVNGQFKCLGSSQHLKSRFGDGYTVSVRVRGPQEERDVTAVKRFMARHFPASILKESHHNMVLYELPSSDLSLSSLFSKMEDAAQNLNVEDYSVSQNTLDNVFINFVKKQQELVQESCETATPTSVAPSNQSSPDVSVPTELQPLVQDSDDVLLDLEDDSGMGNSVVGNSAQGPSVRSRLAFLDADLIDC